MRIDIAQIELEVHAAGHAVDRAGMNDDGAHRGHGVDDAGRKRRALDGEDEL